MAEITCNIEFEDLSKGTSCQPQMSGVKRIWYASKRDILKIPRITNIRAKFADVVELVTGGGGDGGMDIVMKSNAYFFEIYSGRDLGELVYEMVGSNTKALQAKLELMHPGIQKEISGFVSTTMNDELIFLVMLNDGNIHLLGDLDRGVDYESATMTSGKAVTDDAGSTLHFIWNTYFIQHYLGKIPVKNESSGSGSAS